MSIMESGRPLTTRERALYRTSTGLVLAVMLFSIVNFVFNDRFPFPNGPEGAFEHLGFPPYFKVELTVAKILGVLALLIPAVPFKVKEFAYAGFAITLASAAIAHFGRGDARNLSVLYVVDPLVFLCLLAVSYFYFEKSHSLQPAAAADKPAAAAPKKTAKRPKGKQPPPRPRADAPAAEEAADSADSSGVGR